MINPIRNRLLRRLNAVRLPGGDLTSVTGTITFDIKISPETITNTVIPVPPAPDAPVISAIISGNTTLTVIWSAAAGAESYEVYADPGDAAAGASVTAGLATTAILTGLRNGTIYHVRVKAVNAYGSAVSVRKAGYPYDPALPGDIASKNQPPAAFVSDWANLSYGDKYAISAGAVSYDYGYSNYPADFTGDVKYVSEYGSKGVIIIEYTIPPGKPYTDANTPASNFLGIYYHIIAAASVNFANVYDTTGTATPDLAAAIIW